jgi:hypothetical protein
MKIDIPVHICNQEISGWMMAATPNGHTAQDEYEGLTDAFLKILGIS